MSNGGTQFLLSSSGFKYLTVEVLFLFLSINLSSLKCIQNALEYN